MSIYPLHIYIQDELGDCGLTCIAMIAKYYNIPISIPKLKDYYGSSSRGMNLLNMKKIATDHGFGITVVKFDEERIPLHLPALVHWDNNHFVIIEKFSKLTVTICDPSLGRYQVSRKQFEERVTSIAIEFAYNDKNVPNKNLLGKPFPILSLFKGIELKGAYIILLIIALLVQAGILVTPLYTRVVIDDVINSGSINLLIVISLGFLFVTVYTEIIQAVRKLIQFTINISVSKKMQQNFLRKLISKPLNYFEKRHPSSIYNKHFHIDSIQEFFTVNTITVITDVIQATLGLFLLFIFTPLLDTVSIVFILFRIISRRYFHFQTYNKKIASISTKLDYDMHFLDVIEAMQAIKLYNAQTRVEGILKEQLNKKLNSNLDIYKVENMATFFNHLSISVERIILLTIGAFSVNNGDYALGVLMTSILYRELASQSLDNLVDVFYQYRELFMFGDKVQEIYETNSIDESYSHSNEDGINGDIEIKNLQFRFSRFDSDLFYDLSLKIKTGEKVAIIGPSGIGKSTLAKLICGILKPNCGTIMAGGLDINKPHNAWVRKYIGTVMQDDKFLSGSIFENIRFYNTALSMAEVIEATKIANIYEEIMSLHMAFETMLGGSSVSLSAGQLQRILISRAVCCKPKIIIMDEATANLDVENEKKVSENLSKLNVTLLMIAHRPETINSCERVIDLKKLV